MFSAVLPLSLVRSLTLKNVFVLISEKIAAFI